MDYETARHRSGTLIKAAHRAGLTKSEYSRGQGTRIPRATFNRVVHAIMSNIDKDITQISPKAVLALQRYIEQSIGAQVNKAVFMARQIGGRDTLTARHFMAAKAVNDDEGGGVEEYLVKAHK